MKIERLEPSKHKAGRWLVWFDDGSLVRVSEGDVVSHSLYAGKELTIEETEALERTAGRTQHCQRGIDLLAARPMSRKELVDKLCAPPRPKRSRDPRKWEEQERVQELDREILQARAEELREQAEAAADRLEELGLLNDGAYAQAVVRHYAAKGYGPRRIRDELYRRGVPRELWDEALEGLKDCESPVEELARRKLRGAEPTREDLKKVSDYLARRGFGWEEISAALDRIREEWE